MGLQICPVLRTHGKYGDYIPKLLTFNTPSNKYGIVIDVYLILVQTLFTTVVFVIPISFISARSTHI